MVLPTGGSSCLRRSLGGQMFSKSAQMARGNHVDPQPLIRIQESTRFSAVRTLTHLSVTIDKSGWPEFAQIPICGAHAITSRYQSWKWNAPRYQSNACRNRFRLVSWLVHSSFSRLFPKFSGLTRSLTLWAVIRHHVFESIALLRPTSTRHSVFILASVSWFIHSTRIPSSGIESSMTLFIFGASYGTVMIWTNSSPFRSCVHSLKSKIVEILKIEWWPHSF